MALINLVAMVEFHVPIAPVEITEATRSTRSVVAFVAPLNTIPPQVIKGLLSRHPDTTSDVVGGKVSLPPPCHSK